MPNLAGGAWKLTAENLKDVWTEFSTLSLAVFVIEQPVLDTNAGKPLYYAAIDV